MVALVKEMTKGEDRRERLLRRARPSDQKTLLKRFERERACDAQRIRELSQEREALLRASGRDAAGAGPRRRLRRRAAAAADARLLAARRPQEPHDRAEARAGEGDHRQVHPALPPRPAAPRARAG